MVGKEKTADEWPDEKLKKGYGKEKFDKPERKKGCPKYHPVKIIYDMVGPPPVMTEAEREALYLSALRPLKK